MDKFADFWDRSTAEQKRDLAEKLGTSVAYLSQVRHGHRNASRWLQQAIIAALSEAA